MTGNRGLEIRIGDWGFWILDWGLSFGGMRIGDWNWDVGLEFKIGMGT